MSLLQAYLTASLEDHSEQPKVEVEVEVEVPEVRPVSEEEEYEADDHLEEVEEERREIAAAVEQFNLMQQEVDERVASLESFAEVLSFGIEKGQFSPQFAGTVQKQLDDYKALFGGSLATPSLEDHNHESLGEYYQASLEGFGEIVKSLQASVTAAASKVSEQIKALGTNEKAADALIKKADAALEQLSGKEFDGSVTVKLAGLGKVFNNKGTVPSDILRAISTDQKSLSTLYKSYVPAAVNYASKVTDHAIDALNDKNKADASAKAILAMKFPRSTIPAGIADGSQLLGAQIDLELPEKDKLNEKALKELAGAFSYANTGLFKSSGKAKDGEVTMSKSQVESLLKAVKVYAEQLRQLSRESSKELSKQAKGNKKIAGGQHNGLHMSANVVGFAGMQVHNNADNAYKQMNAMGSLVRAASQEAPNAYKDIAKRLEGNARAALALAKRFSEKAGKPKKEEASKGDEEA